MNNFKFITIISLTTTYLFYKLYKDNINLKNKVNKLVDEQLKNKLKIINLYEDKIKLQNKVVIDKLKITNLIEEKENLKSIVNNLTIEINCYKNQCNKLIEENNLNISKINQTEILFYDELIDECYDNIPCSNIKKLIN